MKRWAILILISLILCSCERTQPSDDPLAFVRLPMTVEAAVQSDAGEGRICISFTDTEHYAVRFEEPEIMRGVCYERDGAQAYLTFGASRVPVTDGQACMASLALARLFIPDYTKRLAQETTVIDGQSVQICKVGDDTLTGVIYFASDGVPYRIDGCSDGFSASFTELAFTYE